MIGWLLKWLVIGFFLYILLNIGVALFAGYVSEVAGNAPSVQEARTLPIHDWNNQ
jgi:hypothetical protein